MARGPGSGYTYAVNDGPNTTGPVASASTAGAASGRATQAPVVPAHELLRRIGAGSYGEVWLARSALGTFRAVKIVRRAAFDDDRPYEREFAGLQKFEPLSRTHEGFVDLLQVGRDDAEGWFYYVMELADDADAERGSRNAESEPQPSAAASVPHSYLPRTLASLVRFLGARPLDDCLRIARTLAGALVELHRHGLVHRDIKPSNIIFVDGVPKLADVGLVAVAKGVGQDRSFVGTEGFIPPEGPGTPSADLYSLGIVLYMLATGKSHRDFPEPPDDLATRPDRERWLEFSAIIHRACQASPRDRYPTATALLADLGHLDAGKSVKRRHSLQRGWAWTWKMAAVLALVGLAFVLIRNERDRRAALVQQNLTPWEKHGTTNIAAWQVWQRALQMGSTYTTVGLSNAIQEWERATELDPNYLGAWSALSVTMTIAVQEGHFAGTNLLPRAKACAEKAIALNPQIGAPYLALAQCNLALDYDFAQAEPLFRRGIALGARHWSQRNNFAWELLNQGRFAEAEQLWLQLKEEQPELANAYFGLGYSTWVTGNHEQGLALFEEAIRLQPDRPFWRSCRGDFLWAANQRPAAAQDWLREVQLGGFQFLDREADAGALRQVLHEQGPEAFLEHLIALAEARQNAGQFVAGFDLARLHAHAGNRAQALNHLETALAEHSGPLLSVRVNPAFQILRDEPRYHAVLRRLKLEP